MTVESAPPTPRQNSRAVTIAPARTVALHHLDWDTAFFGSQMGTVQLADANDREASADRSHRLQGDLRDLLRDACAEGYAHLTLRLPVDDFAAIWAAEQAGFRLIDVGVDSSFAVGITPLPEPPGLQIRDGRAEDVPELADLAADSFLLSRFSVDPFFSTEQVRDFHREWVRNLCAGLAERVLVCDVDGELAGFIACAIRGDQGRIALIAARADFRRRGLGRSLVSAALHWFATVGARVVQVKTQAQNYPALALYHRTGFTVSQTELTFSIILGSAEPR